MNRLKEEVNCEYCNNLTEFICEKCKSPTCEDCLVKPDQFNMIDYCICQSCQDGIENREWLGNLKQWQKDEEIQKKKQIASAKRKAKYYTPEAIEKRRLKKVEIQKLKYELRLKHFQEAMNIMKDFFK